MKPLDQIAVLLPYHGFDDFPARAENQLADNLLACWTALWHPALILASERAPQWIHRDALDADSPQLVVVPYFSRSEIGEQFFDQLSHPRTLVTDSGASRNDIVRALCERIELPCDQDPQLLEDFYSLGYCYMQVERMTQHMRYTSGIADSAFEQFLVDAARSAFENDQQAVRDRLQACFDFLTQEREHYYGVDVFLLDVALLHTGLNWPQIQQELEREIPLNIMADAQTLKELAQQNPEFAPLLKGKMASGQVNLLGGEFCELPTSLVSSEAVLNNFRHGLDTIAQLTGERPQVFARRRFGLAMCLPSILNRLEYQGALHATLDDGRFPEGNQIKSRWVGEDDTGVEAIMRSPLDATQSAAFVNLATSLSESMDMDHVATRVFVRWAGQESPWFDQLRRISQYTNAVGRLATFRTYFTDSYDTGIHDRFRSDQYRSPYLRQDVSQQRTDPLSRWQTYWRTEIACWQLQSLATMRCLIQPDAASIHCWNNCQQQVSRFRHESVESISPNLAAELHANAEHIAREIAGVLGQPDESACMLVNASPHPRRCYLPLPNVPHPIAVEPPVYANAISHNTCEALVDVPGFGVASIVPVSARPKATPEIGDGLCLRNEFIEVEVSRQTGGIQAFKIYGTRTNLVSQLLGVRLTPDPPGWKSNPDETFARCYTKMMADEVKLVNNSQLAAEIIADGRLVDHADGTVTRFQQRVRLERGSRFATINVQLEDAPAMQKLLGGDPWNSYLAARFAWSSEATDIYRYVNDRRYKTTNSRFESPLAVNLDDGSHVVSILNGGLPYHRKVGRRMLDLLLSCQGESAMQFQFAIGVDAKQPLREALNLLTTPISVPQCRMGDTTSANWLMHVNNRNVLISHAEPIINADQIIGIRVRLIEVDGRPGTTTISCVRPIESARKINFVNNTVDHCSADADQVKVRLTEHEMAEVELIFRQ
ncbi:MAG: hypothetical protein R3C28_05875 [Pirellulaceae bacterium]